MLCKRYPGICRANENSRIDQCTRRWIGCETLYANGLKIKSIRFCIGFVDEEQEVVFLQVKGKFDLAAIQKLAKTSQISYLCH